MRTATKLRLIFAAIVFVIIGLAAGALAVIYIRKYAPSKERMSLETFFDIKDPDEAAVILNGDFLKKEDLDDPYAYIYDGKVYFPLTFITSKFDDRYYYDYNRHILRYTTTTEINEANTNEPGYTSDGAPVSADYMPVILYNDRICLASEFVEHFTPISCQYFSDPNRVLIYTDGFKKDMLEVTKDTELRRHGGTKSPILADVKKGNKVMLLEDYGDWSYVLSENGELGCIMNKKTIVADSQTVTASNIEMTETHNLVGKDISLAWHQVTNETANSYINDTLDTLSNVNVMSPTWYYINDSMGSLFDISSSEYVDACHERGYQVWSLVSNVENKEVDYAAILNDSSIRDEMIANLVSSVAASGADGINLDFEEIPFDASDGYIEMIRELSLLCKRSGLILSVDNYVPTDYTSHYNRKEQARYADYIVIMGYDEHNFGSTEAGSNASIGFVTNGVIDTLDEVPAEQVILGMPLYGRAFYKQDGGLQCSALSMDTMQSIMDLNPDNVEWKEDLGQYYVKYVSDDVEKELWVENADSLKLKFDVLNEYGLAGAAYWKLTLENSTAWDVAGEYLNIEAIAK